MSFNRNESNSMNERILRGEGWGAAAAKEFIAKTNVDLDRKARNEQVILAAQGNTTIRAQRALRRRRTMRPPRERAPTNCMAVSRRKMIKYITDL